MTQTELKIYFGSRFQGMENVIMNLFTPIFGEIKSTGNPRANDYVSNYGNGGANIEHIYDYGHYIVPGGDVSVWEVVLADNCHISRARKNIQNTIRGITENYTGAFIIFHYADGSTNPEAQTWRLSWLMRTDAQVRTSPAKRYTYLCGPSYSCRTIVQRFEVLQNKPNKTLSTITTAFDVEALSEEFFKEYKVIYDDIVQWITGQRIVKVGGTNKKWETHGTLGTGIGNDIYKAFYNEFNQDNNKATKAVRDYVKKLLGRLVFIQFLQKKGWLKIDGVASSNFLLDLFNKVGEDYQNDFIERVLEKVVYLLLNNENRLPDSDKVDELTLDVPFLNGGLFEPDEYDNLKVRLPKEFFHNEAYNDVKRDQNETRLRDKDNFFTQCGILDLFYQYNFTIDENDPNDAEIGVDPEMLGKIFENLLEDNKEKGVFYTPKEIVQYMCNESLIAYLQTKVPNHNDEIRQFILNTEKSDVPESKKILNAIKGVKICDPAIGSGAFPMGLLNLLVSLREKLEGTDNSRCDMKKEIICNNIYGVDIEKGAIDIARLRFWLSIMVDENTPTPLPNFDYKFMQGNSLLTTFDLQYIDIKQAKQNVEITKKINDKKKELLAKKNEFYGLSGEAKYKKELEIKLLIVEILKLKLGFEQKSVEQQDTTRQMGLFATSEMPQNSRSKKKAQKVKEAQERVQKLINKLLEIERQLNDETKTWEQRAKIDILFFDWEICFAEIFPQDKPENEKGFDIVIGNPPYIRQEKLEHSYKELLCSAYHNVGDGTADILVYFFGLGINILKTDGDLCFITSNKFLKTKYGKNLRTTLTNDVDVVSFIDFFELPVFHNASTDAGITLLTKRNPISNTKYFPVNTLTNLDLTKLTSGNHLGVLKKESEWQFVNAIDIDILKKVEHKTSSLGEFVNNQIYRGITTGLNEAFVLNDESISKALLCSESKPIIKRYAKSTNIERWQIKNDNKYFIASGFDINLEQKYPTAYRHLHQFKEKLETRCDRGIHYYNLRACAYYDEFEKEKIIYIHTAKEHKFYLDTEGRYINNSCYMIISDNKYLLCYLNSKLFHWYKKLKFVAYGDGQKAGRCKLDYNKMITVPIKKDVDEKPFDTLYNRIKSTKVSNPQSDTSVLERKIDILIYLLYGLTYDEVMVVENASQGEKLNLDKATYDKWLELYTENGALPSEEEMEKAVK